MQRLVTWYLLERAGDSGDAMAGIVQSNREKVAAVAEAQRQGQVTNAFSAAELLSLVLHLSLIWAMTLPEFLVVLGPVDPDRKRQLVVDAVARLVR